MHIYLAFLVLKLYAHILHLFYDNLVGNDQIREDHLTGFFAFVRVEAPRMNDAHLLENSRLARLASSCSI